MANILWRWNAYLAGVLVFLVTGCTSSTGPSGVLVDPSSAYQGSMTQATITAQNAETLAMGGYTGGSLGAGISALKVAGKAGGGVTNDQPVRQLAEALKLAARRMDLPGIARQRLKTERPKGLGKLLGRSASYSIPGEQGGSASLNLDVNDHTGSFSGTINFSHFAGRSGLVLDGTSDLAGTFDANYNTFTRLTFSFRSLSMQMSGGGTYTLVGSISNGLDPGASSEYLSINMVLINGAGQTYWFKDYNIDTTYRSGGLTQTVSGRYYHPGEGYVDFTSPTHLGAATGSYWPTEGAVKFLGRSGTWARITFSTRKLVIDAETNGSGDVDWSTEWETNTQAQANTAPTADAGSDQAVSQWSTVALNGTASSDPDGDPLAYSWSFQSCPQYPCPPLSGATTATPSFIPDSIGSYVLGLTVNDGVAYSSDTVQVTASEVPPSSPSLLQQQWKTWEFGASIGQAGLFVYDIDNDGTPEIIASASAGGSFGANTYWYVVRTGSNGNFAQVWCSERYGSSLVKMALVDINGDGRKDVVVGLADGTVHIYDGSTLAKLRTLSTASGLATLAVADIDGDGIPEIVTSNGTSLFAYASDTGNLKWSLAKYGGSSLAIGNVDGDAHLEIVTTSYGGKGYVIDAVTQAVKWEYANGFGAQVFLADLDGDGMQEIVAAAGWYKITVFNAELKSPAWEIATDLDIAAVSLIDVNGDGIPEIVYGDGQWGSIHAVSPLTHADLWSVHNPSHGVSGIAWGDADRDGTPEIFWGGGGTSTGADYLYGVQPGSGAIEWQSVDVEGPYAALAVGDVDGDGKDEVVTVSWTSDSGYESGIIYVYDAQSHAVKFQQRIALMDWMGVRSVAIGDVDGDGKTEFVITTANVYDGCIQVYDGQTFQLKRQSAGYDGNYFTTIAIADVDNDGKMEIVTGQGREHTGAKGVYILVLDGTTLQEKWRSVDIGGYWSEVTDLKVADVDGDGHPEIIAATSLNQLLVYDGINHTLKTTVATPGTAVAVADVDGDGSREILVGRSDGMIDILNGTTFALKGSVTSYNTAAVNALQVVDLTAPGSAEWLISAGGGLKVLGPRGQGLVWRSESLAGGLGNYNHLGVKDVDGDGKKEIFIGGGSGVFEFR